MAKLLLLDDEPLALEWITAALAELGHEVRGFQDARSALEHLGEWRPDLIIADILMPELDGIAFARLVRAQAGPPVLFISIATKQAEAVLAGAVGYVTKPATAAQVRSAVTDVLGHLDHRATILIVDDDIDARDLYRTYLEPAFEVVESDDGSAALRQLHARPIDLVITDFHMPHMNGLELIRSMRADAALEQIPVIVQTSDRAALRFPQWSQLGVAYRLEKEDFLRWLAQTVAGSLASLPSHSAP